MSNMLLYVYNSKLNAVLSKLVAFRIINVCMFVYRVIHHCKKLLII